MLTRMFIAGSLKPAAIECFQGQLVLMFSGARNFAKWTVAPLRSVSELSRRPNENVITLVAIYSFSNGWIDGWPHNYSKHDPGFKLNEVHNVGLRNER